jgi:hypothetical protein
MKKSMKLLTVIFGLSLSTNILAATQLAALYELPKNEKIKHTHNNIFKGAYTADEYIVIYEKAHIENNIDSQVIDNEPLKQEIITKTFVQASKTFYWSEII